MYTFLMTYAKHQHQHQQKHSINACNANSRLTNCARSNLIVGFSLIEMMTSLLLFSILMVFAVPGVARLVDNNRISANTIDFLSALQFARSEAIKRGSRVTICIANANFNQCNSTGYWQNGWLIFADPDGSSITIDQPSRHILRVHQQLHGTQTSLALPSLASGKDGSHISFLANGSANDQTTGRLGGWTFVLCDQRALRNDRQFARKIVINQRGYARAVPANDDSTGSDVTKCL